MNNLSPSQQLDLLDKAVNHMVIDTLRQIQSGHLGAPSRDDLNRCGLLHSFLEQGGTIASVVKPV